MEKEYIINTGVKLFDHNLTAGMTFKLRDYQQRGVTDILNFFQRQGGKRFGVAIAPCGAGKSLYIGAAANQLDGGILVVQPSKELLAQNFEKYVSYGNMASVFSASMRSKDIGKVTFATPMSLKGTAPMFKHVKYVFVDECHTFCRVGSILHTFIKQMGKDIRVVGLTATPVLLKNGMDGAELRMLNRTRDSFFNEIIHTTQIQEIVSKGFWTPLRYEIYRQRNEVLVINSNGAEYTNESLNSYFFENKLADVVVDTVNKYSKTLSSILVFTPSVEAANVLSAQIPKSAVVSADTPSSIRDNIVRGFRNGDIKVVFNCLVLTTGFDFPDLRCVIDCTPTMSLARYYQKLGRCVRIADGKKEALIIDFGNNFDRFGKIEDISFEDFEGHGWGMFSGENLISEKPINSLKITKQDLLNKANIVQQKTQEPITKIWFGKYKDMTIGEIPLSYMRWTLENLSFDTPMMIRLKEAFVAQIKKAEVG